MSSNNSFLPEYQIKIGSDKIKTTLLIMVLLLQASTLIVQNSTAEPVDGISSFFSIDHIGYFGPQGLGSEYLARALGHIGIEVHSSYEYVPDVEAEVFANKPIPLGDEGGFDIMTEGVYGGNSLGLYPVNVFDQSYFNSTIGFFNLLPYEHLALFNYNNSEYYDIFQNLHIGSVGESEVLLRELVEFLDDELPIIPLLSNSDRIIYSNFIDISQNEIEAIGRTQSEGYIFSEGWANLSNTGKTSLTIGFDQTFKWVHPFDFPLIRTIDRMEGNFPSMVFEGLYQRDYSTGYEWKPLLADGFPTISTNGLNITVKIKPNITFADGEPLTAYDVVGSYQIALADPFVNSWINLNHILNSPEDILVLDNSTIQFNLRFPSSGFMEILKLNIIPTHIWGNYSTGYVDYFTGFFKIEEDLLVNSTTQYGIGTGPYMYSTSTNEFSGNLTLIPNPNYRGTVGFEQIYFKNYLGRDEQAIIDLSEGKLDIALGNLADNLIRAQEYDLNIVEIAKAEQWMLLINHLHPVLGTGVDTPLGKRDPSRALEAAKYVRQAISHAIPRETLPELFGFNIPTSKPYFTLYGDFDYIPEYDFNFEVAKSFMKLAEYQYPEVTITDLNAPNPTSSFSYSQIEDVGYLSFPMFFTLVLIPTLIKTRRKNT